MYAVLRIIKHNGGFDSSETLSERVAGFVCLTDVSVDMHGRITAAIQKCEESSLDGMVNSVAEQLTPIRQLITDNDCYCVIDVAFDEEDSFTSFMISEQTIGRVASLGFLSLEFTVY